MTRARRGWRWRGHAQPLPSVLAWRPSTPRAVCVHVVINAYCPHAWLPHSLSLASSWSLLAGDTGRRARDRGAGSKTGSLGGEPGRIQMWQDRGRAGQHRRVRPGVQGRPGRQALSGIPVSDNKRSARALWLPGPDRAAFDPGHTGRGCRSRSRTFPPLHLQRGPRPLPPGQQDAQSPPEVLASRFQTGQVPIIAREGLTLASATAAPGPRARPQPVAQALGPCDLPTPPSVPSPWPSHPEGPREGT